MTQCNTCPSEIIGKAPNAQYCSYCARKRANKLRASLLKKRGDKNIAKGLCRCCDTKIYRWHLCEKHYKRARKQNRPNTPSRIKYNKAKSQQAACKIIYHHDQEMKNDPDALTTEFMEDMTGVSCARLKKKKEGA